MGAHESLRAQTRRKAGDTPAHSAPGATPKASATPARAPQSGFYTAGPALSLGAPVQAKLVVGQAGDPFEREADAVAESVVAGRPAPALSAVPPEGPEGARRPQGLRLQRQPAAEEEEEPLTQPLRLQRQPAAEEEEEPLTQPLRLQRQAAAEEEEEPLTQPLRLQRQAAAEEEEEPLTQPLLLQRQAEEESPAEEEEPLTQPLFLQRQAEEESPAEEEEPLTQPLLFQRQPKEESSAEEEEPLTQPLLLQRQPMRAPPAPVGAANGSGGQGGEGHPLLQRQPAEESPAEEEAEPTTVQTCRCSGPCSCGGSSRQEERDEPAGQVVQRRASGRGGTVGDSLAGVVRSPGAGEPLRPQVRDSIEQQTGMDMGGVQIHRNDAATRALGARAFTHGSHIWLGPGESSEDLRLLAHESAHVIQQGSATGAVQTIQRAPADYRHPEDGGGVEGRLNSRFSSEIDEGERQADPADARRSSATVDRAQVRARSGELRGDTRPDVDRPAQESPGISASASVVEEEANTPADPLVEAQPTEEPSGDEGAGQEVVGAAEQAASLAEQAFATAAGQPQPTAEAPVEPPAPIAPVDSAGEPLDANPAADTAMFGLAERAQYFRDQGTLLRAQAAEGRQNAETTRGNLARVSGEISKAEEGISTSQEHATYRREVVGQAEDALGVSEEKQAQVAAEAPGFQSKADEGKEDTGPMASEAGALSAENAANIPDDEDAAADAREQGGQIDQVGAESQTMDSAVTQTRSRADSLAANAARAAELNSQARGNIDGGTQQLDQLDQRLSEHETQAGAARAQVDGMNSAPEQMHGQAEQLDQQGQALIASSVDLEAQLRASQERYAESTRAVPALEPWEGELEGAPGAEGDLQLLPEEGVSAAAPVAPVAGVAPVAATGAEPTPTEAPAAPAAPEPAAPAAPEPATATPGASGAPEPAGVSESAQATGFDPAAADEAEAEQREETAEGEAEPTAEGEAEAEAEAESAEAAAPEGAAAADAPAVEVPTATAERRQVDVLHDLPPWLTGVDPQSAEQREQAAQAAEQQRLDELNRINQLAGRRPISQLGAGERMGIAMRLVGQRYFRVISNISWPGWGGLARALLDPRSMLAGAVGGLNMILSGGANLFSAEQWRRDPLGNLLKSAADIATGLAIILGSVTALAGIVAAVMGALILITFGAAAPVALPVISVCTTIITTVGGWTIAVGKVALVLQALSLIKNLIDAATAQTAEELQREAGEIQSDINGAFQAGMSIVGAKGAQAGIRNITARAGRTVAARTAAGGSRALARRTAQALPGAARSAMRRFRRRLVTAPRRAGRRLRAAGRAIVEAPGRAMRGVRDRLRGMRDRLRRGRPDREAIGPHGETLRGTRSKGLGDLSDHELQAELNVIRNTRPRRITRGDYVEEVHLPNGHTWRRNRHGVWCRFSDGAGCLVTPDSGPPVPPAPHAQIVAGDRYRLRSRRQLQDLRDHPPQRPPSLMPEDAQLWNDYIRYYNNRLDQIEGKLIRTGRRGRTQPPRTWDSYRDRRTSGQTADALRGQAFQRRVSGSMDEVADDFLTETNVGLSSRRAPRQGQVRYADQLIRDQATGRLIATSNKSRDFARIAGDRLSSDLNAIRSQVVADVDELFTKYSGPRYIRRSGHAEFGQRRFIREVALVYDLNVIPRDLVDTIASAARAAAARRNPSIVFHIIFQ